MGQEMYEKATFAGGCFWCMVQPFDQMEGIIGVVSGYMGGTSEEAVYEKVKKGTTGHYEVVQITFDPILFPYEKLLDIYWPQIDPTDENGQFHDRGPQYRTAIFYHNEHQKELAELSKKRIEGNNIFNKPIVTKVIAATDFYPAEEYHQDYYKKEKDHYKEDRKKSGRDEFIKKFW